MISDLRCIFCPDFVLTPVTRACSFIGLCGEMCIKRIYLYLLGMFYASVLRRVLSWTWFVHTLCHKL